MVACVQTARVPVVPKPAPTNAVLQTTFAASEDQWSELGATAQCGDGKYFHGKPDQGACFEHGGVRKWLQGREQTLIR
jgi:hypothetical protein